MEILLETTCWSRLSYVHYQEPGYGASQTVSEFNHLYFLKYLLKPGV